MLELLSVEEAMPAADCGVADGAEGRGVVCDLLPVVAGSAVLDAGALATGEEGRRVLPRV